MSGMLRRCLVTNSPHITTDIMVSDVIRNMFCERNEKNKANDVKYYQDYHRKPLYRYGLTVETAGSLVKMGVAYNHYIENHSQKILHTKCSINIYYDRSKNRKEFLIGLENRERRGENSNSLM